jgi:Tfp pilus assembly protein PilX
MRTQTDMHDGESNTMTRVTRALCRTLRTQAGIALPMAIGIMMILSISLGTVVVLTQSNQSAARRGTADDRALTLAEAGLNNALSVLYAAPDPTSSSAVGSASESMNGGTASYTSSLSGMTWTLTGTGTVASPVAGGGNLTRKTTMQVTVGITPNSPWYYTFADSTSSCMDLKKDAVISTPLYVRGNLCLGKDGIITGSPLAVDGTLTLASGATVGSAGAPIAEAHLVGGCTGGAVHPCSTTDGVYATTLSTTSKSLTKPAIDLDYWYLQAKPGPSNSCSIGSVPGNFDNDGNGPNNSRAAFDLMPGSAYDCRVTDGSGTVIGRLTWTPGSPGTLAVAGTIFFDGNISVADNAYGVYTGRATIYSSGTVHFGKDSRLCGVVACDSTWNWNTNLLMLVAGSASSGETFTLEKNVTFQGQAYAVGDFSSKKDANLWGPVIADELDFAKDAGVGTFPSTVPPGAPGADTVINPVSGTWRG